MAFLTALAAVPAWLLVLATTVARPLPAQVTEQDVKAAFLYNFTRFVEWPAGIPPGAEPFRLCVIADDRTAAAVDRTMQGEAVNGRPVQTVAPATREAAQRCQILFVGRGEAERAAPLVAAVRDLPVLTVGDGNQLLQQGGAIEFVLDGGRVRFDVNLKTAKRSGLTISSRLLQVARNIEGRPK